MIKKTLIGFLIIVVIVSFSLSFADIEDVPEAINEQKVFDYANLFSEDEIENLEISIRSYIADFNMDMIVVTTNENKQKDPQKYADDFYDYNKFGIGPKEDGILFLIDMDTRNIAISTKGEAIRVYDDARIESILDDAFVGLPNQDYYGSAKAFVASSRNYASKGIPDSNTNSYIDDEGRYVYDDNGTIYIDNQRASDSLLYNLNPVTGRHNYVFVLVVGLGYAAIATSISYNSQKNVKQATSAYNYLKNTNWKRKNDRIVSEHTTSVYIPPADTSSSGGYSGGSSVHHSSSGSSHGGGSRHF